MVNALAFLVIIIFCGAIYAFVRSIFLFIFSQGDPENKKKARDRVRFMIIGLVMTIGLLFMFPLGLKMVGVPNYEAYSAKNIFQSVSTIFSKLLLVKDGMNTMNAVPGVYVEPGVVAPSQTQPQSQGRSLDPSDYEL
ncbi:MAG: hypothetical protein NZL83_01240 [Candidatus Absconditabacterales bacterium]|nr:hypothetical protein [Candidatus Absconditabacterales bacterium]